MVYITGSSTSPGKPEEPPQLATGGVTGHYASRLQPEK